MMFTQSSNNYSYPRYCFAFLVYMGHWSGIYQSIWMTHHAPTLGCPRMHLLLLELCSWISKGDSPNTAHLCLGPSWRLRRGPLQTRASHFNTVDTRGEKGSGSFKLYMTLGAKTLTLSACLPSQLSPHILIELMYRNPSGSLSTQLIISHRLCPKAHIPGNSISCWLTVNITHHA